jgi:hypothetical protein
MKNNEAAGLRHPGCLILSRSFIFEKDSLLARPGKQPLYAESSRADRMACTPRAAAQVLSSLVWLILFLLMLRLIYSASMPTMQ